MLRNPLRGVSLLQSTQHLPGKHAADEVRYPQMDSGWQMLKPIYARVTHSPKIPFINQKGSSENKEIIIYDPTFCL